jgi:hypothetical protein
MIRKKWFLVGGGFAAVAVLAAAVAAVYAQPNGPPPKQRTDRTKESIEVGPKAVVGPAQPAAAPLNVRDFTKSYVELPAKTVLAQADAAIAAANVAFVNPKVQPGKVNWHQDLDTARLASVKSGKPVLLFHMMGRLDDRFC